GSVRGVDLRERLVPRPRVRHDAGQPVRRGAGAVRCDGRGVGAGLPPDGEVGARRPGHRRPVPGGQGGGGRVLRAGGARPGRRRGPGSAEPGLPGRRRGRGPARRGGRRRPRRRRMNEPEDVRAAVGAAHRHELGPVLAATARTVGDLDLAEECVQEAYVAAIRSWTQDGVPDNPAAWLTTAAKRRAVDLIRRRQTLRRKLPLLIEPAPADAPDEAVEDPDPERAVPDDRLRLIFTCCHPALAQEAQVALTLRLLCGVSTADIAAAFLVSEATMTRRISRAKAKIADAGIPYRVPAPAELPDRLRSVLAVVHLVFTRSEERRVGKECRSRWGGEHYKTNGRSVGM